VTTQQQWNNDSEDDVQMPLGVGTNGETEFSGEEPSKPKVNRPTLVLFGAFAAALIVIYLLGMQSKPRAASAQQVAHEQEVQSAIHELMAKNSKTADLHGLFSDTNKLMKMVYSYLGSDSHNTPELPHDPFANDEPRAVAGVSVNDVVVPETDTVEAQKLRKVAETFSSLKLQSVMLGHVPVAMINNRMVTVGAKIDDLTVAGIEADRVLFNYGKNKFELKLANQQADPQ
jgi:hypothetical protein